MLGLVQRVSSASVSIEGSITGEIGPGILLLLGVQKNDSKADAEKLLQKIGRSDRVQYPWKCQKPSEVQKMVLRR